MQHTITLEGAWFQVGDVVEYVWEDQTVQARITESVIPGYFRFINGELEQMDTRYACYKLTLLTPCRRSFTFKRFRVGDVITLDFDFIHQKGRLVSRKEEVCETT